MSSRSKARHRADTPSAMTRGQKMKMTTAAVLATATLAATAAPAMTASSDSVGRDRTTLASPALGSGSTGGTILADAVTVESGRSPISTLTSPQDVGVEGQGIQSAERVAMLTSGNPLLAASASYITPEMADAKGVSLASVTNAGGEESLPGDIALMRPVASTRISSPFGWRVNPTGLGDPIQLHIGQDYPVPTGTPVRSSAEGVVTFSGWHPTGGMRVMVDHGNGVVTAYSHNSALAVKVGDRVPAGGLIALAGSTGNSTGPHVHFEVIVNGQWVNPALYLPAVAGQPRALTDAEAAGLHRVKAPATPTEKSQDKPETKSTPKPDKDKAEPKKAEPSASPSQSAAKPEPEPAKDKDKAEPKKAEPSASPSQRAAKPEPKPKAEPASSTPAPKPALTESSQPTPAPAKPSEAAPVPTPSPTPSVEPSSPAPTPTPTPEPTPTQPVEVEMEIDPETGFFIDPDTGELIDPETGERHPAPVPAPEPSETETVAAVASQD